RERVGILPEKESPPSFLTPREYFQFVGAVRDLPDEQVDVATDEWAQRLGFNEKLDTLSSDLSRGQKQKVMIATAFLHEPAAVFIDEPLANLDPLIQERVKRFLAEYREAGNTVLISTHNVEVAAELCTRVGILYDGRLLTDVRPGDLDPDRSLLDVFVAAVDRAESGDTSLEDPVQDDGEKNRMLGGEMVREDQEQDRTEDQEQDRTEDQEQDRTEDREERADG
ncbi:MAG: AAA family ATPase, partial [Halanaeroarchaeum sp.]